MTDATLSPDASAEADHGHDSHAHDHPTEKQYWLVFLALAVITAAEVAWSYLGLEGPALVIPLIVMMLVKFCIVAGAFMHLYYDLAIPHGRVFLMAFTGGLVLAMAVYFVVFAAFQFEI